MGLYIGPSGKEFETIEQLEDDILSRSWTPEQLKTLYLVSYTHAFAAIAAIDRVVDDSGRDAVKVWSSELYKAAAQRLNNITRRFREYAEIYNIPFEPAPSIPADDFDSFRKYIRG